MESKEILRIDAEKNEDQDLGGARANRDFTSKTP